MKFYYPKDKNGRPIGFRVPASQVICDDGTSLNDKLANVFNGKTGGTVSGDTTFEKNVTVNNNLDVNGVNFGITSFPSVLGTNNYDLNDMKTTGAYILPGSNESTGYIRNYTNIPNDASNGWLVVLNASSGISSGSSIKQLFFRWGTASTCDEIWQRTYFSASDVWSTWNKVGSDGGGTSVVVFG